MPVTETIPCYTCGKPKPRYLFSPAEQRSHEAGKAAYCCSCVKARNAARRRGTNPAPADLRFNAYRRQA